MTDAGTFLTGTAKLVPDGYPALGDDAFDGAFAYVAERWKSTWSPDWAT